MQKIIPNLWYNANAKEAVDFYLDIFPNSKVIKTEYYPSLESGELLDFQEKFAGEILQVDFELMGYRLLAINAGPEFSGTPASSFMINFDPASNPNAESVLREVWEKLKVGGRELMPLQKYDFSELYSWVEDKYGYSWQLILTDPTGEERPAVIPSLMFGNKVQNRADEAREFYLDVFKDTNEGSVFKYPATVGPADTDSIMFSDLKLEDQWFVINDSGVEQDFTFTPAVSYLIQCEDQAEIDYYWNKLSSNPEFEQCGWCQDQFGVSWQIVPKNLDEWMKVPGNFKVMLGQKKIVVAEYNK